jgi:hypothetical protein
MIVQHLHHNQAIAAGAIIPAGEESSFATTQAVHPLMTKKQKEKKLKKFNPNIWRMLVGN